MHKDVCCKDSRPRPVRYSERGGASKLLKTFLSPHIIFLLDVLIKTKGRFRLSKEPFISYTKPFAHNTHYFLQNEAIEVTSLNHTPPNSPCMRETDLSSTDDLKRCLISPTNFIYLVSVTFTVFASIFILLSAFLLQI